ncbi:MAG: transketolase family protein [bacterium]
MAEQIATRDAYGKALAELGERNPKVVVLDADLSGSTKTAVFAKKFPERFFNMGVAEQDLMGTAAGFALMGKIAFASTFAVFATGRAWEIVRQSIVYPHLNVKICASHAGLTVGEDGASHQTVADVAIMRVLPGMTVLVPADAVETEQMVAAAAAHDGPVYIRLSRAKSPVVFDAGYSFKIGKAKALTEGKDLGIIACGLMVPHALEAAKILEKEGIHVTVVNCSTIKPLDEATILEVAKKTGVLITVEEHSILGGLGSAVSECLGEAHPVRVFRMGVRDEFGQSAPAEELLKHYRLMPSDIAAAAKKVIQEKK